MTENLQPSPTVPCRFCCQPIDRHAIKCHHCGEQLVTRSQTAQLTRKLMGAIGVVTAVLSLFFGLKEGYFFIQERQENRAMADSYLAAAERFIALDSLVYAEQSLEKALSANPSDQSLRVRAFFMRANHFLREADYYGMQLPEERFVVVQDMVLNGFSLLNSDLANNQRVELMLALARLLQYDRRWESPQGVSDLFEQAMRIEPRHDDVHYWFGLWLTQSDEAADQQRGFELLQSAAKSNPDNAMYSATLAEILVKRGEYKAAFEAFRRAIESKLKQDQLQQIRAANLSKGNLALALIEADKQQSITAEDFFGLSVEDRLALIRFAVSNRSHRQLQYIAAKLFHHAGHHDEAEALIRKSLGSYDFYSNEEHLSLFADILDARGNKDELDQVQKILTQKQDRLNFDDILESSVNDGRNYKIGLKSPRSDDPDGVLVIKAYERYPFHKAGVRDGDRIIQFGHREFSNLRSIVNLIFELSPGTDVPLTIQRGENLLDLTFVVE